MSVMTFAKPRRRRINLRAETRLALLAGAEACWVYAVVLTLGGALRFSQLVSPLGIFFVYWMALLAGRYLPPLQLPWRVVQALNLAVAILSILLVIRFDLLRDTPLLDPSWLPAYLGRLSGVFERFTGDLISTLVLVYAYARGLGYAERPLTMWFVGYQFRLGVVIFFLTALVAGFIGVDFRVWLFVYFVLALLGISLARIEESGREMPLGSRWAVILVSSTVLVAGLAYLLTRVFSVESARAFFALLSPLGAVLRALLIIILTPISYIVEGLVFLLAPLLRAIARLMGQIKLPTPAAGGTQFDLGKVTDQLAPFFPALRLLGLILVVFAVAYLLARGLSRRMRHIEEEAFILETVDDRERSGEERIRRPRSLAARRRRVEAENIRRIYAALLALAAERGLPRREAETPYEFLPRLVTRFPFAEDDLGALTEAYVAVHYAQVPATSSQVRQMRDVWRRLRELMARRGG